MNRLMEFAVALAPVFAAWAVAASIASIRTARADLAQSAVRGLVAATACAVIAAAGLTRALIEGDLAVHYVAQASSVLMPVRYVPAALLSAPGGALLMLAALSGIVGLLVVRNASGPARRWATTVVAAAMLVSLLIVAAAATPFALRVARADGAGLSSDLQRGGAVLHGIALLLATVFATASFADTLSALATGGIDDSWSRRTRRWNALAWTSLLIGVVAGARWYAMNPVRGAWLESPVTALWLLPCFAGAWLIHLDAGVQDAKRVVTRLLLGAGAFIALMIAVAFTDGAFLRGVNQGEADVAGALIGIVPVIAIAGLIARLRRGAGVLRAIAGVRAQPKSRLGGWIAHAGFILLVCAAAGSRMSREHTVALRDAEIFRASDPFGHRWQFSSQGMSTLQRENYASLTVSLLARRDDVPMPMLSAEARSYGLASGKESGLPAFITGTLNSLFMETRLTITQPDGKRPTVRIAFVPLAPWVMVGAWLIVIGTLLPLAPARTETPA